VHPEANARSSSNAVNSPPTAALCVTGAVAVSAGGRPPVKLRTAAMANIRKVNPMNE
jgi:hypothetical protein